MLKRFTVLMVMLFAMAAESFADKQITFTVNMSIQRQLGVFFAGRGDTITTFIFSPGSYSSQYRMTTTDTVAAIYTYTLTVNDTMVGQALSWKFFMKNGTRSFPNSGYETVANNRGYTVTSAANQSVPTYYFNDVTALPVTRRVRFQADMTALIAGGFGGADSINVGVFNGSTPDGTFGLKMVQVGTSNIYISTRTISLTLGDSISWKFKCSPDSAFANSGYDIGANRYTRFPYNTQSGNFDTLLAAVSPNILKKGPARTTPDTVYFRVDLTGAKNAIDNSNIPLSGYVSVWINGFNDVIGGAGTFTGWTPADTAAVTGWGQVANKMIPTRRAVDVNGAALPSRPNQYTGRAIVAIGQLSGGHSFKYGAYYVGQPAGTNGALDNFAAYGADPSFSISTSPSVTKQVLAVQQWGVGGPVVSTAVGTQRDPIVVATKYSLSQNYPNPFNPTTSIKFSLPQNETVTLSVYNILGQKVATLVDGKLASGAYTATFNADKFASGVYFYRLQAGNFVETKKMMLVK